MISRTPQPGHRGVPSVSGRAHVGQLKTCASGSPIAPDVRAASGAADSRHFSRCDGHRVECGVERSRRHPTRWSRLRSYVRCVGRARGGDTAGMRLELTRQGDYAVRAMLALAGTGRRRLAERARGSAPRWRSRSGSCRG